MTRKQFKINLLQSIEKKDQFVEDEDIERFLSLNFEEDNSLSDWTYDDFYGFSSELCNNYGDFWETVRDFDLHTPDKHYRIKTNYIEYCIDDDEIDEIISNHYTEDELENMSEDEYDEIFESLKEDMMNDLPQILEYELDCQEDDLEDIICDWISNETGYLINDFGYSIEEN